MRITSWVVGTVLALGGAPGWAQQLKVGDPAPPLAINHWIKGEPVDLAKARGKHFFLLEFWATWCPPCIQEIPHLTELQAKYRDAGLVVLGLTSPGGNRQTLDAVEQFVRRRGDEMKYTIGWENDEQTATAYMAAAGLYGIPAAFVVDREGKIAWSGYSSPDIEQVIEELARGTYDNAKAKLAPQCAALFEKTTLYAQRGDWSAVLRLLDEILDLDPTYFPALQASMLVHIEQLEDTHRLAKWARRFIDKNADNARALSALAGVLMNIPGYGERQPEITVEAARRAHRLTGGKDSKIASNYARALYWAGNVDAALKVNEAALEFADQYAKDKMLADRDFYLACKRAQNGDP